MHPYYYSPHISLKFSVSILFSFTKSLLAYTEGGVHHD